MREKIKLSVLALVAPFANLFSYRHVLTPVATMNYVKRESGGQGYHVGFIGYTLVYVFGVRVARLQRTNPWR